jgi:hypothetical protein
MRERGRRRRFAVRGAWATLFVPLFLCFALEGAASAQNERWVEVRLRGEIPAARLGHSLTNVDGRIFMFGGLGNGARVAPEAHKLESVRAPFNEIWEFDAGAARFDEITPMNAAPPARDHHTAVSSMGKLWIFFGFGQFGALGDVWSYDPATKAFAEMPDAPQMPGPRAFHSTVAVGDKIYLFGGLGPGGTAGSFVVLDDTWEYDPAANTWRLLGDLPDGGLFGAAATAIGAKIVSIGGFGSRGMQNDVRTLCTDDPGAGWADAAVAGDDPPPIGFANLVADRPGVDKTDGVNGLNLFVVAGEIEIGGIPKPSPTTFLDRELALADACLVAPEALDPRDKIPVILPVTSAPAVKTERIRQDLRPLDALAPRGERGKAIFVFGGRTETGTATDRAFTLTLEEPAGPDLTGAWESLAAKCNEASKCKLKGSLVVRNAGVEAAPASTLSLYLSADSTLDDADLLLKRQGVAGLAEDAQLRIAVKKVKLPTGTTGAGMFVIAVIDDGNAVGEGDEGNNEVVFGPL